LKHFILLSFLGIIVTLNSFAQKKINYLKTSSGLEYALVKKGKGEKVKKGCRIYVNYTTRIKPDTVFDSNSNSNPYAFIQGQEEVLKGWEEGVSLLREGDSAHFKIPPTLAYGEKKLGTIPANTTLLLEVKIVKVEQAFYDLSGKDTVVFPSGLKKVLISKGTGELAIPFNNVTMQFTGYVLNKKGYKLVFQSSLTNSNLAVFQLGAGRMVKGLDEGIAKMRVGERASFIVPPSLGFGDKTSGIVPGNSTLFFDIELLGSDDIIWHTMNKDTLFGKDGLKILPVEIKKGSLITTEDIVTFDYTGYFYDSLKRPIIFDNTIERKDPVSMRPGAKSNLPFFKESLTHLKTGEKAILFVPPAMAFGNRKNGIVPLNTSIVLQVNILDTKYYPFFNVSGLDTVSFASGLKSIFVRQGTGDSVVTGNLVSVAYTGFVIDSLGKYRIFDASRENGKLLEFVVGKGKVIKGLDEAVKGMRVGESRRLIIPFNLGYGEKGVPDVGIPAKSTLYFDIELVEIKDPASQKNENRTQIK
jgi:peptidylprolyl isomerase